MEKLRIRDCTNAGEFGIIDAWTKKRIEDIPWQKAFEKYGECLIESAFTTGFSKVRNPSGTKPSFKADVWIDIPGMKLGYMCGERYTIPSNNPDEATFVGKKTGQLITVTRNGKDDYEAWWRDESEADKETAGYSVRGTMLQIIDELKGEI